MTKVYTQLVYIQMLKNYPTKMGSSEKIPEGILITKEEALRVWSDPKTKVLFTTKFDSFEAYWEECQKINALSVEEKEELVVRTKAKFAEICHL